MPTVRLDIQLKTQRAILDTLLPALLNTIEQVTTFMVDPDDDDEIRGHLRELATETVIDEVVSLLTRDLLPASRRRMVHDVDGIGIDTLIACHSELMPDNARKWYAARVGADHDTYMQMLRLLPEHADI
ncbi:MAG: hypothetical protein CUN53_09290 [Phototrophicales bacterium]|nr:MAG: hypothetical protein CUN53_09290 [Phototrophicales bacterium]